MKLSKKILNGICIPGTHTKDYELYMSENNQLVKIGQKI